MLGATHGIKGVLDDKLYDMSQEDREELKLMRYTPSSALGSCRYKLADPDVDDTDYKRILCLLYTSWVLPAGIMEPSAMRMVPDAP